MTHEYEQRNDSKETLTFSGLEVFAEGKNPPKNEDSVGYNESTLVLSDGATDKSGQTFEGSTGGELASALVVETCLQSQANGMELIEQITANLRALYERINPKALDDSAFRFAATMVVARVVDDELVVTQIGDTSFRINGTDVYTNNKLVDELTANARKAYIDATQDVAGSRDFIMPLLKAQHKYQNNPDVPLGYGIIDGTPIPEQFIRVYSFPAASVSSIELVTDGYYGAFPAVPDAAAYEELYRHIEEIDPNKCGDFPSTKLSDDRTVLIAQLG